MKKKVLFICFSIAICFVGRSEIDNKMDSLVDCGEYAADHLAVHEDYFGCLPADDYNWLYGTIKALCDNSQIE